MELVLKIDGQNMTFVTPFISGRKLRDTIQMSDKMQKDEMTPEQIDMEIDYIVGIFGNQFTRDQFYDGIESDKVILALTDCISTVMGKVTTKLEALAGPNV